MIKRFIKIIIHTKLKYLQVAEMLLKKTQKEEKNTFQPLWAEQQTEQAEE